MAGKAFIIGNSDGIGLAITSELLNQGWKVFGFSRSASPLKEKNYQHTVIDVQQPEFPQKLQTIFTKEESVELCIYCAGVGELLDISNMDKEIEIFQVNLMGMIKTVTMVIPAMVKQGQGHFIGISSVADELLSEEAPSYHASKAAFSNYLEGLALAVKPKGVAITNLRFGFVNTKMAKGDKKPFMIKR